MQPVHDLRSVNLMRKLLFAYVIFSFFQIYSLIPLLYNGQSSLITTQALSGFTLTTLINLLSVPAIANYYVGFFIVQVLFAFIGLLGFFPRISSFLVFFTTMNLQNRIYSTNSGGDILLCLMLFYLSFISGDKKSKNENLDQITNVFNRTFIILCKAQLVIIYLVSAVFKLQSSEWIDGTALSQILLLDEYSIPALQSIVCSPPFAFKILTWLTLLYQLLFPVLIFVKRFKNYLLLSGLLFHLFIAFAMGLFNFSLVMICSYAVFYDSGKMSPRVVRPK